MELLKKKVQNLFFQEIFHDIIDGFIRSERHIESVHVDNSIQPFDTEYWTENTSSAFEILSSNQKIDDKIYSSWNIIFENIMFIQKGQHHCEEF